MSTLILYKIFCLSNAANILAEEDGDVIRTPMLLMASQTPQGQLSLSMSPLDLFNKKGEDLYLNKNLVLFSYEADNSLVEQYKTLCDKVRASRAGIVLPDAPDINSDKIIHMEGFKKK